MCYKFGFDFNCYNIELFEKSIKCFLFLFLNLDNIFVDFFYLWFLSFEFFLLVVLDYFVVYGKNNLIFLLYLDISIIVYYCDIFVIFFSYDFIWKGILE